MRFYAALVGLVALSLVPSMVLAAAPAPALTDAQKAAVEDVVRELLIKKEPEIVMKAAKNVQEKLEKEMTVKSAEAVKQYKDKLDNDPTSPVGGNPKGDVTVVEFFDYQCHYCKTAQATVAKLLGADKNVRFVYKDYPILGQGSMIGAKAALASVKQGKYEAMHEALMASKERLDEETVIKIGKSIGLDPEKLKKDMDDASVMKIIQANIELGTKIGARGTPSFIIGEKLFPGVLAYDQMKQVVDETRKGAPQKK